jgi:signal peptidase
VVTHRVVGLAYDGTGRPSFQTQGDANDVADPEWVRPVQVRGATWYAVPYVGRASSLLTHGERQWAIRVVAGALLAYGVAVVVAPWLRRARPRGRHA